MEKDIWVIFQDKKIDGMCWLSIFNFIIMQNSLDFS